MSLIAVKHIVIAGLLGAGAVLAGCQSSAKPAARMSVNAPTAQATSCPKCRMVTESNEAVAGSHRTPAVTVMRCDGCTNAVTNLLTRGEFAPSCTTTGDKPGQTCMTR